MATQGPHASAVGGTSEGLTRSDLMAGREVAELLDVPLSTLHEWGRKAVLPGVKLGRHRRLETRMLLGTAPCAFGAGKSAIVQWYPQWYPQPLEPAWRPL